MMVAKRKLPYEKPVIRKQEKMVFPLELINYANGKGGNVVCRQCSSCHGCR